MSVIGRFLTLSKGRPRPYVGAATYPAAVPEPRVISTADVLRALPYHRVGSWHSHGRTLVPTESCAACDELKRRQAVGGGGHAVESEDPD